MKVKTSKLTDHALDWAVARAEGMEAFQIKANGPVHLRRMVGCSPTAFRPSTNWAQGGPIIEREKMWVSWVESNYKHIDGCWSAYVRSRICYGPTPLIAAMRSFVASKLGDEVEVPGELMA